MRLADLNVFVVEDSHVVVDLLLSILYDIGCGHVTTANDFETARSMLSAIDGPPYDVVFLDRYLPEDKGLTLIDLIRRYDRRLPIIMVTVEDEGSKVIEAITRGATDYVVKPFTLETIQKKLLGVLGQES